MKRKLSYFLLEVTMEGILENEQYNVKSKCKECGSEYNEKVLGAMLHTAKNYCPTCNLSTEVFEVKPVRQVLLG
jgi:uncharacterized OB-fold protein